MRTSKVCFNSYSLLPALKTVPGSLVTLPVLNFSLDEGMNEVFSKRQLDLHINKHHQSYIDKINAFLKTQTPGKFEGKEIETIARSLLKGGMFNQFAQHLNHSFYWSCMKAGGGPLTAGHAIGKAIERNFGSLNDFKEKFTESGLNNFGSGWTWLLCNGDKLKILNTSNADLPNLEEGRAILTIDVWEHSYYCDWENRRGDYLKDIWKVIDWSSISENFDRAMST